MQEAEKMDVGGTIKRFRILNKMEQKDLAKLLHVSDRTISSWERNRTQPKMEMIEMMCQIFHCKKSDFLDEQPTILGMHFNEDRQVERLEIRDQADRLRLYAALIEAADPYDNEQLKRFIETLKAFNVPKRHKKEDKS